MDNFLQLFFPHVASKTEGGSADKWCTYNDAGLQMFTSSLFLAACIAGLVASPITRYTTMEDHRALTLLTFNWHACKATPQREVCQCRC